MNAPERIKMVKAMEFITRQINDEGVFEVRDEDREDLAVYIEDESFADLIHTFLYVMKNASRSGGLCCDKMVDKEEQYE